MEAILAKYGLELIFGLISAGALALCRYYHKQSKELSRLQKDEENRKYRQMIVDEIEPIQEELRRAENDIKTLKKQGEIAVKDLENSEKATHKTMYKDLEELQKENERKFEVILNSYKYRLIQLCKYHLREGFISPEDYDQISEMHKLYTDLGGNGQAEEYFQKVKELDDKK